MKVLIIGAGGREHALTDVLNLSPSVEKIYAAPGNPGILELAEAAPIDPNNFVETAKWCKNSGIDLVVIGPEAPLVDGISDILEKHGIKTFGPSKLAAEIEGSKAFMKDIVAKYNIPTAAYNKFTDPEKAKEYCRSVAKKNGTEQIVVKTDGLAAGKGVIIAETTFEAESAIDEMFAGRFGDAGKKVVIEEFLSGEEASFFAICDGKTAIACGSAQDHKRIGEGDTGPNTGGMGTYSPAPIVTPTLHKQIMEDIILPTVHGMRKDGKPYKGFLFAGVMIENGVAKLLEFNVRFGDPEAQSILRLVEGDFAQTLLAAAKGDVSKQKINLADKAAMCVVMAAKGYPEAYEKGTEIKNVGTAESLADIRIYHAGTKLENSKLLAVGGRVLGITALGHDVKEAQRKAYKAVEKIDWAEGYYRKDIGWRAL